MIDVKWTIENLEHNVSDGSVITAHWRVTAQEGDYTATAYGSESFNPDPTAEGFIPYDQLTEADVLAWVWASESVNKDILEERLAAQIEKQKNPPVVSGTPWA